MNRTSVWLLIVVCIGVSNLNAGSIGRAMARGAVRSFARSAERSVARGTARSFARSFERSLARGAAQGQARPAKRLVARGTARATAQQATRHSIEIQRKDLLNHLHTPVRPLPAPHTVHRYTSPGQARQEMRTGVAPGRHMTATAPAGRPPSPGTAMNRYGLQTAPHVRETIELPKGIPVRHNKVPGGRPGVGEITSSTIVPPEAIKRVTPLR